MNRQHLFVFGSLLTILAFGLILAAVCASVPTSAPPTPVPPTPTPTPAPAATKVWAGGTIPVETNNLIINYPDFLDRNEAKEQAEILQKAYDTYLALFGKETPYGGKKITINFDRELKDVSYAGNPMRIGTDSEIFSGRVNPPNGDYYSMLVVDFTSNSKTQAALH